MRAQKKVKSTTVRIRLFCLFLAFIFVLLPSCSYEEPVFRREGMLTVHYLDVGQSDCTFVEIVGQYTMMIDAADAEHAQSVCDYVSALGYDSIDILVLTHPHSDHVGGVGMILERFSVGMIYTPEHDGGGAEYVRLMDIIDGHEITVNTAKRGVSFAFGGAECSFLSPADEKHEDENDMSAVLRLSYGEHGFLFMGDCGSAAEAEMLSYGCELTASAVKAGHHGSNGSSSEEFVEAVGATYAVFSCGEDNEYGHPSPYAVDRWERSGAMTFRTDKDESVIICTDGFGILAGSISDTEYWNNYMWTLPSQYRADSGADADTGYAYILRLSTRRVHKPSCAVAKLIDKNDREESDAELERLEAEGFTKCSICFD